MTLSVVKKKKFPDVFYNNKLRLTRYVCKSLSYYLFEELAKLRFIMILDKDKTIKSCTCCIRISDKVKQLISYAETNNWIIEINEVVGDKFNCDELNNKLSNIIYSYCPNVY